MSQVERIDTHDPGGKVRLRLQPGVIGAARFSDCGRYRYSLERRWEDDHDAPFMLSIGLNPSTAEANVDDPTIRRDIALGRRLGLSRMIKVNVVAYRSTKPGNIPHPSHSHAENMATVILHAIRAKIVVACWGRMPRGLETFAKAIEAGLFSASVKMWCLGTNKDGSPKHPLYLRGDARLVRYDP